MDAPDWRPIDGLEEVRMRRFGSIGGGAVVSLFLFCLSGCSSSGEPGPRGEDGPPGPEGPAGSPDTPEEVRDKLLAVDGEGSGLDADTLDGLHSTDFVQRGGTGLIDLPPHGAGVAGVAEKLANGVFMPNANAFVYMMFTVPDDHRAGTNLTVNVVWSAGRTRCNFLVAPNLLRFSRPGHDEDFPVDAAGMTNDAGTDILAAPAREGTPELATFTVEPHDNFDEILPRDIVLFGLWRSGGDPLDTCEDAAVASASNLVILGTYVEYQRELGR